MNLRYPIESLIRLPSVLLMASLFVASPAMAQTADKAKQENVHTRLYQLIPAPAYTRDDIEAEITFGRQLASKILGKYPVSKNDKLNRYVNEVGKTVAANSRRSELNYHFIVLNTPIINAFSTPGGYVFITQGAIDQVKDESELAAILAHEIGHIEERDYVKKIGLRSTKEGLESGLTAALSGGKTSAAKALNEAINQTMEILFSKGLQSAKDEYQADQDSVWLLANTGYDPTALERYFKRIQSIHAATTSILAKTHPPLSKRIAKLEKINQTDQLSQLNYARLQERYNENR